MSDVIRKRRSIRRFEQNEVPRKSVEDILRAAFFSPSSNNRKPWHFILVSRKDLVEKLSRARDGSSMFAAGAPLVIVVCADSEIAGRWVEDCAIAAIIIQLMATELGLGSCWIHIRDSAHSKEQSAEDYLKGLLAIPKSINVLCMIALGFPAEEKAPHEDDEYMPDRIHWDTF